MKGRGAAFSRVAFYGGNPFGGLAKSRAFLFLRPGQMNKSPLSQRYPDNIRPIAGYWPDRVGGVFFAFLLIPFSAFLTYSPKARAKAFPKPLNQNLLPLIPLFYAGLKVGRIISGYWPDISRILSNLLYFYFLLFIYICFFLLGG